MENFQGGPGPVWAQDVSHEYSLLDPNEDQENRGVGSANFPAANRLKKNVVLKQ